MNFVLSTKPFADALNLGIVNSNVSKFYQKSCLAQVTASRTSLTVNLEASNIVSQVTLKGSGDEDAVVSTFVDSLLLKQLVSTFDAATTTVEFAEGGLILHSGRSKFNLPKMSDASEMELAKPSTSYAGKGSVDIDKAGWKFVKEHQMYAIAMSFIHRVYTNVWASSEGHVLVGDFDNSLFTYSKNSKLNKTCLLPDTIINLFNAIPDGAKLYTNDKSYIIQLTTDGYDYLSEFTPNYEEDERYGSYNSEMILDMMKVNEADRVSFKVSSLTRFLNQADLLSTSSEDTIKLAVSGKELSLTDNNVDCKLHLDKESSESYCIEFKTALLKSVIANMDSDDINMMPMKQEDEYVGVTIWTPNMTVVLASVE